MKPNKLVSIGRLNRRISSYVREGRRLSKIRSPREAFEYKSMRLKEKAKLIKKIRASNLSEPLKREELKKLGVRYA